MIGISRPLVSVVMAVRNGGRFLAQAMESILRQSLADLEFIVVDDGSTDATPRILAQYSAEDNRVRVYRRRLGLAGALNLGCRTARGNYIAIMDSDDIAFPDRVERQVGFLESRPDIALTGGGIVLINEQGAPCGETRFPTDTEEIRVRLKFRPVFCHPTIVMRRNAYLEVGGYRTAFKLAVDYDFVLRFVERFTMGNLPEPVLYHRIHPEQVSTRERTEQAISYIVAQMSAQSREETARDPVDDVDKITLGLLAEYGIDKRTIDTEVVSALVWAANRMLQISQAGKAFELLEEAQNLTQVSRLNRRVAGNFHWTHAKACRQRGEFLESVAPSLKAMLLNPSAPAGEILKWLRGNRQTPSHSAKDKLASSDGP